jgi:hypothetical protein
MRQLSTDSLGQDRIQNSNLQLRTDMQDNILKDTTVFTSLSLPELGGRCRLIGQRPHLSKAFPEKSKRSSKKALPEKSGV